MEKGFVDEVIDLHRFFEVWLSGQVAQTLEVFERLNRALDDKFFMISPSGGSTEKAGLCKQLWQAHGAIPEPFNIEIRNARCRILSDTLVMVNYEEWQFGSDTTSRISSALIEKNIDRYVWLQVHETWIKS